MTVEGLMCYENPKNKITDVPAKEEEIWGATFKVTIGYRLFGYRMVRSNTTFTVFM